ncbi:MAG: hypothetical protein M1318_05660 [Firmicutes bacterium]|nr:hypothetical protein [Bacillota bacterium]
MAGSVLVSPPTLAQSALMSPPLTAAQKAQAAQGARETEAINTPSGYVSVSASALAHKGLNHGQIAYVEDTIRHFDAHTNTTWPSASISPTPLTVSPNDMIWGTHAQFSGQYVRLFEGGHPGWGWGHMQCRHNWNTAIAQTTVESTVSGA